MHETRFLNHDVSESPSTGAPRAPYGLYLGASAVIGTALWAAVLSVSILSQDLNPITVAAHAIGYDQPGSTDPMILAHDAQLRLIEPAAGPACD